MNIYIQLKLFYFFIIINSYIFSILIYISIKKYNKRINPTPPMGGQAADTVRVIFSFWLCLFRSANLFKVVSYKINKLASGAYERKLRTSGLIIGLVISLLPVCYGRRVMRKAY